MFIQNFLNIRIINQNKTVFTIFGEVVLMKNKFVPYKVLHLKSKSELTENKSYYIYNYVNSKFGL